MEHLLDESINFFARYRLPSGLYLDKLPTTGGHVDSTQPNAQKSTSAAGFGLIALCVGAERDLYTIESALQCASHTVAAVSQIKCTRNGFMLHWCDGQGRSEFSTIDTAICVLGALFAGNYFKAKSPHSEAARSFAERVRVLSEGIRWEDALIDSHEGAPGMFMTMSVDGVGQSHSVTRIFNEYYLLALCAAVVEGRGGLPGRATEFFYSHFDEPPSEVSHLY